MSRLQEPCEEKIASAPGRRAAALSLTVIVPAYNERDTIDAVLDALRGVPVVTQIVVVDDCSTDGTREILARRAEADPALAVVHHPENRGKGAAIVTGLARATGEAVVIQDADLEYDPGQLADLLARLEAGADVVYGSRFRGSVENMRLPNLVANKILTFLANVLFGARITDEATCYKMFRREVLAPLTLRARRFDFCPEVTAKVRKRGHRIHEVPIRYRARSASEGKKIRWTDGVAAIWALIKYRFVD
jgi:dolichol-phosphate mannosyltransferase